MNNAFSYEILEEIAVISTNAKGWTRELNLVSWNERPAKFDIRDWSPNREKMGKGLSFSNEEFDELKKILTKM